MNIKICGLTNLDDAKLAIELGATALGFNFSETSPRRLAPPQAASIVRQLSPNIWRVGVFVNQPREEILNTARVVGLDTLQFHGDEDMSFCKGWDSWRVIKAIRIKTQEDAAQVKKYLATCDHFLFDYRDEKQFGGSGREIDKDLLAIMSEQGLLANAFLAGGLTPENVGGKVRNYKLLGVDVSSGVESSVGKKDPQKMRSFFQAIKTAI